MYYSSHFAYAFSWYYSPLLLNKQTGAFLKVGMDMDVADLALLVYSHTPRTTQGIGAGTSDMARLRIRYGDFARAKWDY